MEMYFLYIYPRTNSGDKWAEARTTIKADAYKFEWRENSAQWEEVSEEEFFDLCNMGEEFADAVYDGKSLWFTEEPQNKFIPSEIRLRNGKNILFIGGDSNTRQRNQAVTRLKKEVYPHGSATERNRRTEQGAAQISSPVFSRPITVCKDLAEQKQKIEVPELPELGWVKNPKTNYKVFIDREDYILVKARKEDDIYRFCEGCYNVERIRKLRRESVMAYESAGRVFYEI